MSVDGRFGLASLLAASALLAACSSGRDDTVQAPADLSPATLASASRAPTVDRVREGAWLGGPEPVSGKLRSGITLWYRVQPAQPKPGEPFELVLRFEDVIAEGATASLSTSDGAGFAGGPAPTAWRLAAGLVSQVGVRLVAPAGSSYLHVMSQQNGRSSVRSIALPHAPNVEPAPPRRDYAVDAGGEPIVRMRSDKAPPAGKRPPE